MGYILINLPIGQQQSAIQNATRLPLMMPQLLMSFTNGM